jgi:hypothetical protein
METFQNDVFISHASEDKVLVARPLAVALESRGYSVWLDENRLTIGDRITPGIMDGLATSRFGVLILSLMFLRKDWTRRELRELSKRETVTGQKVILPVWHGIEHDDVLRYEPPLADRVAATTNNGIEPLANELSEVMRAWSESAPSPAPILADTLTLTRLAEAMKEQDESFRAVSAVLRTRHEAIKQAIRELT